MDWVFTPYYTVWKWCGSENTIIFGDLNYAFKVTFLNKCDEAEKSIIAEYYQRCLAIDIPEKLKGKIVPGLSTYVKVLKPSN